MYIFSRGPEMTNNNIFLCNSCYSTDILISFPDREEAIDLGIDILKTCNFCGVISGLTKNEISYFLEILNKQKFAE